MTAKRYDWRGVTALGGILFLCLMVRPVSAGEVEERIRALEEQQRANAEELERLKGEQVQMRKEATAAAEALPTFTYRPGAGVTIEAADGSWGFRPRIVWHYRLNFFPGPEGVAKNGFSQFDLTLRRIYPYMTFYWDKRFYEVDFQMALGEDRVIRILRNELHVHFEKLNPYLPEYTVGEHFVAFFNRHDTNWGPATSGFFERSMFQTGAGIDDGSQNNGMGLGWHDIPIGPGSIVVLEGVVSNQGVDSLADRSGSPKTDGRSSHFGIDIEPFNKTKNKWIEGIDLGFAAHTDKIRPDFNGRNFFRVRTAVNARELELINVANNISGTRVYLTPGFGWKIGPYWLRTAGGFNQGHVDSPAAGQEGPLVRGRMWRVGHELFVWSPKGFLTGSPTTPGSLLFFTVFERDDYKASGLTSRNGLQGCSSVTLNGNCHAAFAHSNNVGFWYFIKSGLSVGGEYGFYHVNKIGNTGGARVVKTGTKAGQPVDFQNVELGARVEW